ncbi:RloB domain-containing protein [Pelosinus sp. sgz500959]|uniref:RloB domain-containing protein n=1 Tax=Pelosinus sp. sgz500959 TaxID=3242472 RepID=UPI00366F5D8D
MARKIKPVIYVFWEGESEQVYSKYLKKEFEDVAVIKTYTSAGLFDIAVSVFANNPKYKNNTDATDEIWFFFDTELDHASQWKANYKAINKLRKLRKTRIVVRLLMTTACLEYWLLLHYERCAPAIASPEDKKRILDKVKQHMPLYKKGDERATAMIAEQYQTATINGKWTLQQLVAVGMPTIEDKDERNAWLFEGKYTFTTVHEAIEYLKTL